MDALFSKYQPTVPYISGRSGIPGTIVEAYHTHRRGHGVDIPFRYIRSKILRNIPHTLASAAQATAAQLSLTLLRTALPFRGETTWKHRVKRTFLHSAILQGALLFIAKILHNVRGRGEGAS